MDRRFWSIFHLPGFHLGYLFLTHSQLPSAFRRKGPTSAQKALQECHWPATMWQPPSFDGNRRKEHTSVGDVLADKNLYGTYRAAGYSHGKHPPDLSLGAEDDMVSLAKPGCAFELRYRVGGGGGHRTLAGLSELAAASFFCFWRVLGLRLF